MNNRIVVLVVCLLAAVGLAIAFGKTRETKKTDIPAGTTTSTIQVAASFYPLAHFAERVGSDHVNVVSITPQGVEPHDYEPTPQDVIAVYSSRLFLFNGAGLDPWAERIHDDVAKTGTKTVEMIDVLTALNVIQAASPEEHNEEEGSEDEETEEHEHGDFDPHIWLDPVLAQTQVEIIRDALIALDGAHADDYRHNAAVYNQELMNLHEDYSRGLAHCKRRDIVVSHDAFGYIAKRYNVRMHGIAGISPEHEPSARRLAELTRLVREKNITHIFFESLISPQLANTLARETGVKTSVLNPIEGLTTEELHGGKNYDVLMKENLEHVREALECV